WTMPFTTRASPYVPPRSLTTLFRSQLAAVAQVLPVGWQLDGEGLVIGDTTRGAVKLPEGNHPAIIGLVVIDGAVFEAERHAILAAFNDPISVGGDKCTAVVAEGDGVFDDLLDFKVAQVDDSYAGVGLVIDEQELSIVFAVCLAQSGMM